MTATPNTSSQPPSGGNASLARDHLANERTFLAWMRTGIAAVVFGFAIGRFAIAVRQWLQVQGKVAPRNGASVWFGTGAMIAGVLICIVGLVRYRRTREQINSGSFEAADSVIDIVGVVTAIFGLALAAYLVYIELSF